MSPPSSPPTKKKRLSSGEKKEKRRKTKSVIPNNISANSRPSPSSLKYTPKSLELSIRNGSGEGFLLVPPKWTLYGDVDNPYTCCEVEDLEVLVQEQEKLVSTLLLRFLCELWDLFICVSGMCM